MKQLATGVHFFALVGAIALFFAGSDDTKYWAMAAAVAWFLAMFVPPTGMIGPGDAPDYARTTMRYLPNRADPFAEGQLDPSAGPWATEEAKRMRRERDAAQAREAKGEGKEASQGEGKATKGEATKKKKLAKKKN